MPLDPKALAEKVRGKTVNMANMHQVNRSMFEVLDSEGVTDTDKRYPLMAAIYSELGMAQKTASQGGLSKETIDRADKAHERDWMHKHELDQDERGVM